VLLNPKIDTTSFVSFAKLPGVKELQAPRPRPGEQPQPVADVAQYGARPDERARRISPYHHITAGLPPMLVIHSAAASPEMLHDTRAFVQAVRAAGNKCDYFIPQGVSYPFPTAREEVVEETMQVVEEYIGQD